jgi:hypothetical protein
MPRVTAAAVKYRGRIGTGPDHGWAYNDLVHQLREPRLSYSRVVPGFVLEDGTFLTRKQAYRRMQVRYSEDALD